MRLKSYLSIFKDTFFSMGKAGVINMYTIKNEFQISIKFYYGMLMLVHLPHNQFLKLEFQKNQWLKWLRKFE